MVTASPKRSFSLALEAFIYASCCQFSLIFLKTYAAPLNEALLLSKSGLFIPLRLPSSVDAPTTNVVPSAFKAILLPTP